MPNAHIMVLGARGSIPVSGPQFARYGGATTCFALVVDDVTVAFIDAGTGLLDAGTYGLTFAPTVNVFLTHYHWDHTQGLSMMSEMWTGACDIRVWGKGDPEATLERAISPPLFPVSIADVESVQFEAAGGPVEIAGLRITPFPVNHPQGACGYRIDGPNRSIAIATDHEAGTDIDAGIVAAVDGVEVLIHDAQYLIDELPDHVGWGHSSCEQAVVAAGEIGADHLVLTSHDPQRSDEGIEELLAEASGLFGRVEAARPGLVLPL